MTIAASFPRSARWMDAGPLQPLIDAFAVELHVRRHTALTVSNYENSARHFAGWLCRSKVELGQVDEDVVQRFAKHRCRCPGARRLDSVSPEYVRPARKASLARARELLAVAPPPDDAAPEEPRDVRPPCPCCGGSMIVVEVFARWSQPRAPPHTSRSAQEVSP